MNLLRLLPALLLIGAVAPSAQAPLRESVEALWAGDLSAARRSAGQAIEAAPQSPLPRALQARILLAGGDGQGAGAALDAAIARGFDPGALAHLRAHALLLQGKPKEALRSAGKAQGPAAAVAYAARIAGSAAIALRQADAAAAHYDRALALTPRSSLLWTDIARFRLFTGDAGGAIDATARAVGFDPANGEAALLSAQLTRGRLGPVAALQLFERALELRPGNIPAMAEMAATLAEAGRARAALAMTRDILAIDRANPRAFFVQAVIAARAGRFALSRALLYRTGGRIDGLAAVQLLRGALEIEAGNNEQSIARLQDLLRLRPLHFPARRLLALAHWRSSDAAGTAATLMPMARRADADPWTLALTGRALESQGSRTDAAEFLARARTARPGPAQSFDLADWQGTDGANADIVIPRISQLVARGQAGEAAVLARMVAMRNPGSPGAAVALGDALLAGGAAEEASEAYARAANIDFSEPIALRLIAALNASGRRQEAANAASLLLRQNPRSIAALMLAGNAALATRNWPRATAIFTNLGRRLGPGDLSAAAGLRAAASAS